jgi:hypothetical protein
MHAIPEIFLKLLLPASVLGGSAGVSQKLNWDFYYRIRRPSLVQAGKRKLYLHVLTLRTLKLVQEMKMMMSSQVLLELAQTCAQVRLLVLAIELTGTSYSFKERTRVMRFHT